jgi:hypothetical protein
MKAMFSKQEFNFKIDPMVGEKQIGAVYGRKCLMRVITSVYISKKSKQIFCI